MLERDLGGGQGYRVVAVESYFHAVRELERERFDCVVSDLKMRGPDGDFLLDLVAERWPSTGRVLFSGYLTEDVFLGNAMHHSLVAKATPGHVLTEAIAHEIKLRSYGSPGPAAAPV